MQSARENTRNQWFESLSTDRAPKVRLFCFPYAGGNAHVFREWQRYFAPQVDICLVHLPGRARRIGEPPRKQILPLVREIADEIGEKLNGRFAFYGHSMGALIAFELARELRRRNGSMPEHLFLSACRAPTVVRTVPQKFNLSDAEFLDEVRKLNGTPREVFEHPQYLNALLPLLRADFEITDTYEYLDEAPLACCITTYGGQYDELATLQNLHPWELQTSAVFKSQVFAGDHFFIHSHKEEFIHALRRDVLAKIEAAH
jgi:medium-chain acyl-[acyl-carrier-protein] hydrolase